MREPFSLNTPIKKICLMMSEGDEDLYAMLALVPNALELDENTYKKVLFKIDQCNIRGEQLAYTFEKELTELSKFFDGEKEYPIVDFASIYSKLQVLPEQNLDWLNYEMMCQNNFTNYAKVPKQYDYLRLYSKEKLIAKQLKRRPIRRTDIFRICKNLEKDLTKKEVKMLMEDRDMFLEYYDTLQARLMEQRKNCPTRIIKFNPQSL